MTPSDSTWRFLLSLDINKRGAAVHGVLWEIESGHSGLLISGTPHTIANTTLTVGS